MRRSLDPRCKLYLLLIGNLLLFFHVDLQTEIVLMALFLLPFFFSQKWMIGVRMSIMYAILVLADLFLVPNATGLVLSWVSLLSVGIRMMFPCVTTGAYTFATTSVGEFVCALRRMKVPESIIIPCMVVIRFFPTIREDYRQIRNAMLLRGVGGSTGSILLHPMRSLEYVLIPLLMNSNNVSGDLSVAALTKGIGMPGNHTSLIKIKFSWFDGMYMILCTVPLVVFIVTK